MSEGLYEKYPLFWSDFNEILIFSTDFLKKNSNFKFHQNPSSVGAELFHAGGRTDRRTDEYEVNSFFSQFCARA
jgi:hypothetical protein